MNITMISKGMKESFLFPGMFKVLAYMLVMVEPRAVISREHNAILLSDDVIEGWHQDRENHYRFERVMVIGHDHPYDRYSSLRLFWPEERSPYINKDRITFFECINRTPGNAEALMHVIRGGTGGTELVVDIMYAPVQFMLRNTMIITCDIYTEKNDIFRNQETVLRNMFNIMKTNAQMMPATDRTKITVSRYYTADKNPTGSSFGSKHFKETTSTMNIESMTRMTISSQATLNGTSEEPEKSITQSIKVDTTTQEPTRPKDNSERSYNEATNERTNGTTTCIEETTPKTGSTIFVGEGLGLGATRTSLYTDGPSMEISSYYLQNNIMDRNNSNEDNTSPSIDKTTLELTSTETVQVTSQKGSSFSTNPMTEKITLYKKSETSQTEETTRIVCSETSSITNGTSLGSNETSSETSSQDSKVDRKSVISLNKEKSSPTTEETSLEITSLKIVETSLSKTSTNPITDKTTMNIEDKSLTTTEAINTSCGERSLEKNKTSSNTNEAGVNISSENSQEDKLSTIRSIMETSSPRTKDTTLSVMSPITVKATTQKSQSLRIDKITSYMESESTTTDDMIEKPKTSSWYSLVIKTVPIDSRRKIGLAKISY